MNAKPMSNKAGTSSPTDAPSAKPVNSVVGYAPDYIKAIAPYQPGRPIDEVARAYRLDPSRIIKLASNENPLGMPDSARRAAVDAMVVFDVYVENGAGVIGGRAVVAVWRAREGLNALAT